jgi:hypothetical protein
MTPPSVNLTHLLKLRLVVARHDEMDAARWWNSLGMRGRHGARTWFSTDTLFHPSPCGLGHRA